MVFTLFLMQVASDWSDNGYSARRQIVRGLHRSSYLHVSGRRLVTAEGREVSLRGINIGGWLVMEDWMCGIADSRDTLAANGKAGVAGRAVIEDLEARFGAERAVKLEASWQDHWITAADLDRIHEGGFNLVRVPISYRTLQHTDGSWILDGRGRIDFGRMDWIVREAAARGIYTIFDLHVWPGQRTDYEAIGRLEGASVRDAMAALWTAIAAHYRGNGAIAALDLINEFPGNWGVQRVLADAVRKGDPNRVQIVEGFTFAEFLTHHAAGEFPNSMFSDHYYEAAPLPTNEIEKRLSIVADSPVPVYIGEFLAADFPAATRAMDRAGAAWSSWTYKTVDMSDWGAFNYYAEARTDIQRDGYDIIAAKWSTELTSWQIPNQPINYSLNNNRLNYKYNVEVTFENASSLAPAIRQDRRRWQRIG